MPSAYRGRIAPSPTGYLHLGHARTFWTAYQRAENAGGVLVFRNEDLDAARSKPEYVSAMYEDLKWLGIEWQEGPYSQSERRADYLQVWRALLAADAIYPCTCSRRDLEGAAHAPHSDDEPIYPGTCRNRLGKKRDQPGGVNWRFRVPDGERVAFTDNNLGAQSYTAGEDFGDFLVWRRDDVPSYQLAVVTDDAAMRVTEVVRGADLLKSTARQLLLYRALGLLPPEFYHCELMLDEKGVRLAKRHDALSLRALRASGLTPEELRAKF